MPAVATLSTEQLDPRPRQGHALPFLQELGSTNARAYDGGLAESKESGRPVARLVPASAA